jgi:hypothetical protein
MEYSSTALFYVPAPEEDVILCQYDCRSRQVEHYRDKNTFEEIGGRHTWKGDEEINENTPWHIVLFEYDKDKQHAASKMAYQRRINWACVDLNMTMVELTQMIRDNHPGSDTAEKRELTTTLKNFIAAYGIEDIATITKMLDDLEKVYNRVKQYDYDSKRLKFVYEKPEIPEEERTFAWKIWGAICRMREIVKSNAVATLISPLTQAATSPTQGQCRTYRGENFDAMQLLPNCRRSQGQISHGDPVVATSLGYQSQKKSF